MKMLLVTLLLLLFGTMIHGFVLGLCERGYADPTRPQKAIITMLLGGLFTAGLLPGEEYVPIMFGVVIPLLWLLVLGALGYLNPVGAWLRRTFGEREDERDPADPPRTGTPVPWTGNTFPFDQDRRGGVL